MCFLFLLSLSLKYIFLICFVYIYIIISGICSSSVFVHDVLFFYLNSGADSKIATGFVCLLLKNTSFFLTYCEILFVRQMGMIISNLRLALLFLIVVVQILCLSLFIHFFLFCTSCTCKKKKAETLLFVIRSLFLFL